jgi:hypothetical protein
MSCAYLSGRERGEMERAANMPIPHLRGKHKVRDYTVKSERSKIVCKDLFQNCNAGEIERGRKRASRLHMREVSC